ncbi:protein translocase subunit SecD [Corynebacterium spheniscorum]|uniref:Protein translocase subunit SecD n=1 Tax=Corynebacterium spheniscorum TaxID=185761 RepID=A0A1I2U159_9CORY|nr:protein translocase subunit SecD [Corynebacterium spheniscorum]KAA8721970.1 protein translocase subunit SecD [Corynebacterium spheniscorum]SFG68311.1 preprotein translocase subunit SecD [Corynebacterium spheniscorum]
MSPTTPSVSTRPKKAVKNRSQSWPWRALSVFALLVIVVYSLVFFTGDRQATPKLGIDLQGGTRVTLVPQGAEPTQEQLSQARIILEKRVNGMGVSGADVVADGNTLVITVPGEDTSEARAVGQTSQLLFRPVAGPGNPDIEKLPEVLGDMANRWVELGVVSKDQASNAVKKMIDAINQSRDMEQEGQEGKDEGAEAEGASEGAEAESKPEVPMPEITAETPEEPANSLEAAERRREVTAALAKDRQSEDATTQIAASALLVCDEGLDPLAGTDDPSKPLVTCDRGTESVYILAPAPLLVGEPEGGARLTGNEIDTSRPITGGLNTETSQMEINFAFKAEGDAKGSETWAKLTQEYLKRQVAITLDSQVISAPVIQSATPVGSGTSITGQFTQKEAQELANNLKYGALPLSFAGENGEAGGTAQTVPASLGVASLKAGLIAGLVGLVLVMLFVFAYYRALGLVSIVTLVSAGALVYGLLVLLGRWIGYSLDLAGVAGLIIGIGTTADSFVVFYERVKDEVRDGRTFRSAAPRGWERAKRTIITGNMVTLIGAVVIYFLAVGEVKGFAFTLGLTTLFDIAVTFLVTAPLMLMASRKKFFANPAANGMKQVMDFAKLHAPAENAPGYYRDTAGRDKYAEHEAKLEAAGGGVAVAEREAGSVAVKPEVQIVDSTEPKSVPGDAATEEDSTNTEENQR